MVIIGLKENEKKRGNYMVDDFYKEIREREVNKPSDIKEWKETSNKRLKDEGHNYKVVDSRWHNLLILVSIIFIMILGFSILYFLHLVNIGSFKSATTQQVNLEPSINTTLYLNNSNNYQNYNNIYINNTIIMPNNITVKMVNST